MVVFFEGILDSEETFKEGHCFLQHIKDEVLAFLKQVTSTRNGVDFHWNNTRLVWGFEDKGSRREAQHIGWKQFSCLEDSQTGIIPNSLRQSIYQTCRRRRKQFGSRSVLCRIESPLR